MDLRFAPIDLSRNAAEALAFRRDADVCSFGADAASESAEDHLAWLRGQIANQPEGQLHVWDGVRLVGQMEVAVGRDREGVMSGYVSLFPSCPTRGAVAMGMPCTTTSSRSWRTQERCARA